MPRTAVVPESADAKMTWSVLVAAVLVMGRVPNGQRLRMAVAMAVREEFLTGKGAFLYPPAGEVRV